MKTKSRKTAEACPITSRTPRDFIPSDADHGPDFRWVLWNDEEYRFTPKQARVVELLWKLAEEQIPEVSGAYILAELELNGARIDRIFGGHPAWGTLIVQGGTRGTYRLNPNT